MNGQCRRHAAAEADRQSPSEGRAPHTGPETWRKECLAWAQLFGLAATLYLREPTVAQAENCSAAGQALTGHLPDEPFVHFLSGVERKDLGQVRQEFFDLFFVPVSGSYCPPFAETARAGHGTDNKRVARFFQEAGFIPALLPGLPPYLKNLGRSDHIGFELGFLATVLEAAAVTLDNGEAKGLHETGLFFHETFFAPWAADCGRKVAETARSNYFRACGHLTLFLAETFEAGGAKQ